MADTTVTGDVRSNADEKMALWGAYWLDPSNGVIISIDSLNDIHKAVTDDGGATWTIADVDAGNAIMVACFYDKEVEGDTGNILHILWLDGTVDDLFYKSLDLSTDTLGTKRTVEATLTVSTAGTAHRCAITKTKNGNLIAAVSTQSQTATYKSIDAGVSWSTISDVYETGSEEDWCLLFPANTTDDADASAIFWDRGSNTLSIKMYDDSANTWTESTIATSMTDDAAHMNMDASIRHSDQHLILGVHSDDDASTDDLRVYDITLDSIASPSITTKTEILTNIGEAAQVSVIINQQNDDIYIAYIKGGSWLATTDIYYKLSSNGGTTWGSETQYSETTDDNRLVSGGRTIGDDGGRVQFSFYNDDLSQNYVNLVNEIEIAAIGGATRRIFNVS